MKPNIILVGFMGTGKSSTGRIVANRLGMAFVDMDTLIEERTGMKIPDIFAQKGEPHFRQLERALTQEWAQRENTVIAPGGGIVLNPENIADFSRSGLVICLTADPDVILNRVIHDRNRPLLEETGDKAKRIRDLLETRRALYEEIPVRINTNELTAAEVAEQIIALYTAHE